MYQPARLDAHDLVIAPDPDNAADVARAMRQVTAIERLDGDARYALCFEGEPEAEIEDLGQFYADNDFEPDDANAIADLEIGAEYAFGGGAGPLAIVRRVA